MENCGGTCLPCLIVDTAPAMRVSAPGLHLPSGILKSGTWVPGGQSLVCLSLCLSPWLASGEGGGVDGAPAGRPSPWPGRRGLKLAAPQP